MLFAKPVLAVFALAIAASASFAGQPGGNSRWATYDAATGEQFFALSLQPDPAADLPTAEQSEVVIIIDTSATQTGPVRLESLEVLDELAASLPLNVKASLLACDVETVELTAGLVSATDAKWETAVARLKKRVPLGNTNLALAFRTALRQFSKSDAVQRTIVYIGDGVHRNHLLSSNEYAQMVKELVDMRVSVSSLAIGPAVDVANLAALANNTGGILLARDEIEESPQAMGRVLGSSLLLPVVWPAKVEVPTALASYFPKSLPPVRLDRDVVVIGKSAMKGEAGKVTVQGTASGKNVTLAWDVTPEVSNPDMGFLASAVEAAQVDDGLTLPALGSAGLRAMSFVLADTSTEMVKAGEFALKSGEAEGAKQIAEEALKKDPNNTDAISLLNAAKKILEAIPAGKFMQTGNPFGEDPFGEPATPAAPATPAQDSDPFGAPAVPAPAAAEVAAPSELVQPSAPAVRPAPANAAPSAPASDMNASMLDEAYGAGSLLAQEMQLRQAAAQALEQDVRAQLQAATLQMSKDPGSVKNALKARLEELDSAVDLDPAVRSTLRDQVRSKIQIAAAEEAKYIDRIQRAETVRAQADASQRILAEISRKDESVKQLSEQFNYLLSQKDYLEASKDVAPEIEQLIPDTPMANSVRETSSLQANYAIVKQAFKDREQGFVDAMRGIEVAAVPIDEPAIIYPPAEVWQALSARRKERYGAINLAGGSKSDQKITAALKQTADNIDFQGEPLNQVMETLQDLYNIPIRLNTVELGVAGVNPDEPINIKLPPVSLRSALRQILAEIDIAELTYTIRDEVLLITTQEDADAVPQVKVYPVGDLVVTPAMLQMSGGGGMGGGMGGMGGGMGGMGGGMGGMGGGGMGGGMFAVPDDSTKQPAAKTPTKSAASTQVPSTQAAIDVDALIARFAKANDKERIELDAEVQALVKARVDAATALLATKKKEEAKVEFQRAIDLIGDMLSAGYPQAWMYQVLSLSMEACEYPAADIKRVMLSGLDFDGSSDQALRIANHFIRKGMKREALEVLRDVSINDPYRHDVFAIALPLANETKDVESLKWVCAGVLSKAWPKEQAHLFDEAKLLAQSTAIRLTQSGRVVEGKAFEEATKAALRRDIVVRINWTGKADLDIRVREPSGTICSLTNPQTIAGGLLLGDTSSAGEAAKLEGYSEYYVCAQGYAGQYDVLVRRVWGEVTGGKATVEIYTDYGTPEQNY